MSSNSIILIAVGIDVVLSGVFAFWLLSKRGLLGSLGADLVKIRAFGESVQEMTGEYLRANYSGDPASLPATLDQLLSLLDAKAKAQNLELGRDALKMVLMRAIASQENLPARDAMTALKKVA